MYLWKDADKLSFTFSDKPNGIICKLVTVKDHIFVATTTNNLYHGEVLLQKEGEEDTSPQVIFKRAQFDVTDVASNSEYLFIINTNGHVLKVNPQDMNVVDTIILKEEIRYCSHGYVHPYFIQQYCINLFFFYPFISCNVYFLLYCKINN